ncbi:MAG: hypothetical protein IT435_04025 [Phycisphaerales bacterium]|nr:hypothetical protein [Phycisphaerales bacterium]
MPLRKQPSISTLCVCVLSCASGLAGAQTTSNTSIDPRLKPVSQGTSDANPLSASNRALPADLRMPLGFDRVYRIESASRGRTLGDLYARQSGGLTAVFPRSQYTMTSEGLIPEVPPGTTFYLGNLPDRVTGADSSRATVRKNAPNYIDRSARDPRDLERGPIDSRVSQSASRPAEMQAAPIRDTAASDAGRAAALAPGSQPLLTPRHRDDLPPRSSVFNDETYRSKKIADLLDRAAAAVPIAAPPPTAKPATQPADTDPNTDPNADPHTNKNTAPRR